MIHVWPGNCALIAGCVRSQSSHWLSPYVKWRSCWLSYSKAGQYQAGDPDPAGMESSFCRCRAKGPGKIPHPTMSQWRKELCSEQPHDESALLPRRSYTLLELTQWEYRRRDRERCWINRRFEDNPQLFKSWVSANFSPQLPSLFSKRYCWLH